MSSADEDPQTPLLSVRAAVIFLIGLQAGAGTSVLMILSGISWASAVLAAGASFAGTVTFARSVIR